jgi:K+-sensing histidine kinase KdpD
MPLRSVYQPEPPLRRWARRLLPFICAALSSGAALGLTLLLPAISEKPFFVVFLAATAICSWLYGITSGLTSIGLNTFALTYFVVEPTRSLRISSRDDLIRLIVFAAISLALAWILAKLRTTQQALKLAQERFELAHEIARMWAWELDLPTGKVIWASGPRARTGVHELPLQVWFERIHPNDRERVTAALKRAVATQKPYELEFRVLTGEDKLRWIASSGEFCRTERGDQRMIGVSIDITLRKEAEKALETAAKGKMAGELAHQLNNPLRALIHALYLLHQQVAESEAQQYSVVAQSEAQRVSQLVKEILRLYSKPQESF